MKNPYPEKLTDETSGVEVSNMQHETWNEGAKAVKDEIAEMVLKDAQTSADFPSFHAAMVAWAVEALKDE